MAGKMPNREEQIIALTKINPATFNNYVNTYLTTVIQTLPQEIIDEIAAAFATASIVPPSFTSIDYLSPSGSLERAIDSVYQNDSTMPLYLSVVVIDGGVTDENGFEIDLAQAVTTKLIEQPTGKAD